MPPRKTTKRKAVPVKKVARKPAKKRAAKPSAEWTYGDMKKFLTRLERWWNPLADDVKAVEKLIRKIPARKALSPDTKREFKRLMTKVQKARSGNYPPVDLLYCLG